MPVVSTTRGAAVPGRRRTREPLRTPGGRRSERHGASRRREEGSVLVEFALVAPLLFLILFAIMEFGFIFKDTLTTNNMTRAAVRTGAASGNNTNPSADYQMLSALKASGGALSAQIQGVIIFKASGTSATLPAGCSLTSSVPGKCNVYTPLQVSEIQTTYAAQLAQYPNSFGCASGSWDASWCPGTRVVSQSGNGGSGPDYLGVYISAKHSNVTGFFHSMTLQDAAVMRLEPQSP
jgi:Flp pilus assembly protein TadG